MDLVILALTTWRMASLLAEEDGPFEMFARLRALVGVKYNARTGSDYGINRLAQGMLCVWCNSVWVGAAWTLAYWWDERTIWLALPLALSAGALLVHRVMGGT